MNDIHESKGIDIFIKSIAMEKRVFQNPKIKDKVTLLKSPQETNNEYILLEVELEAKGGNGIHYHTSFTEEFIPVDGALGIQIQQQQLRLLPGQRSTAPVNIPHRFYNPGHKPITFHVKITPAQEGFLQGLKIAYGLAEDGLTNNNGVPKKLDHLAVLLELSDTRVTGFLGFITPYLLWKAKKARKKGIHKELIDKYC